MEYISNIHRCLSCFSLQTKLDVYKVLETSTNLIVEARGISIPKQKVKFKSVIIDDDHKLSICPKHVRRKQFQCNRDPAMEIIWQELKNELKNVFLN